MSKYVIILIWVIKLSFVTPYCELLDQSWWPQIVSNWQIHRRESPQVINLAKSKISIFSGSYFVKTINCHISSTIRAFDQILKLRARPMYQLSSGTKYINVIQCEPIMIFSSNKYLLSCFFPVNKSDKFEVWTYGGGMMKEWCKVIRGGDLVLFKEKNWDKKVNLKHIFILSRVQKEGTLFWLNSVWEDLFWIPIALF